MPQFPRAIIHLDALRENFRRVRALAPDAKILAAIKANAYGHGLLETARALGDSDALGVARLGEAQRLRRAGSDARIVLLSELGSTRLLRQCSRQRLDLVLHAREDIERVCATPLAAEEGIALWLKIDTGMHRLGIAPREAAAAYGRLQACPWVRECILMTHLAAAEHPGNAATRKQMQLFQDTVKELPGARSIANSAGIFAWPELRNSDWVRPGIALYGVHPLGETQKNPTPRLKPVMEFEAQLLALRSIPAKATVGYNGIWRSRRPSLIGTVAAGYGDGYPRLAPTGTPLRIGARRVPLVGQVSMDMLSVDLSDHPHCQPGERVTLWGEDPPVGEVARHAGTNAYDLLSALSSRVHYEYRDD